MTLKQLIREMNTNGGAIVITASCSELEIGIAMSEGRYAVDEDGLAYILRPAKWLQSMNIRDAQAKVAEKLHAVLSAHHEWHLDQTEPDGHGIIIAEAYADSKLCALTTDAISRFNAAGA